MRDVELWKRSMINIENSAIHHAKKTSSVRQFIDFSVLLFQLRFLKPVAHPVTWNHRMSSCMFDKAWVYFISVSFLTDVNESVRIL